jgi:tRNA dimethylallyltransferase
MNTHFNPDPVLVLTGPSAIGKTSLSIELAKTFNCEIISADSMQVYKHMDIGTAKVTSEEMEGVPHHLIDIVTPDEHYDAAKFSKDGATAIKNIHEKNKIPLLTGGTGLYIKALLYGIFSEPAHNIEIRKALKKRLKEKGAETLYEELHAIDPASARRVHKNDTHRIIRGLEIYHSTGKTWSFFLEQQKLKTADKINNYRNICIIGLHRERENLYKRINLRTEVMLENNFQQEVEDLLNMGYSRNLKSMGSIGYRHMTSYLAGEISFQKMKETLARDTRRYAKRQITWFNKMKELTWLDVADKNLILKTISKKLESF